MSMGPPCEKGRVKGVPKESSTGETDDFERALVAAAGIWARRADIGSTEEYVRKLRRDRRGAEASGYSIRT